MPATYTIAASVLLALVLLPPVQTGHGAEPTGAETAKPPVPAAPPAPVAIPLADIATRATEVSTLVAGLNAGATLTPQIETILKTLPQFSEDLDGHFAEIDKTLRFEPTLETLQAAQQHWQSTQLQA